MKLLLAPKTTEGRYLSVVFILFLLLAAMTFIVWKHPDMAGLEGDSQQQNYWLIGGCCITGCIFIMLVMLLWTARSAGKKEFEALLDVTRVILTLHLRTAFVSYVNDVRCRRSSLGE